jgi:Heterokaryon incompatibility protein (HET)
MFPKTEHFVRVNYEWLEIPRIRRWPTFCDLNHHGICHGLPDWKTLQQLELMTAVDVESWNLVSIKPDNNYVALSYVWGKDQSLLETRKNNVNALRQHGSLTSKPWVDQLPHTVKDAILFTNMMGLRYLWVDRLCIIQDDDQDMHNQLRGMASIYANSYFTIIAADGDHANSGIHGLPGSASPRILNPTVLHFSSTCSMMLAPNRLDWKPKTEWSQRGWTFQEKVLSNRKIIFLGGEAHWECQHSEWTEQLADLPDGVLQPKTSLEISKSPIFPMHPWPDLVTYNRLVTEYNSLLLSYESDAMKAFSAIIHFMSRCFEHGFLHGLSEFFFDIALLWQSEDGIKRRTKDFPSWSWVGWQGHISNDPWQEFFSAIEVDSEESNLVSQIKVQPMVNWYKTHTQSGNNIRVINSYHLYQAMRTEISLKLPLGWSRVSMSTSLSPLRHSADFDAFQHQDLGDAFFYFPLPAAVPAYPAGVNNYDTWESFLKFRTFRCFLYTGPPLEHDTLDLDSICFTFALLDDQDQIIGGMCSNTPAREGVVKGQRCELILISAATVERDYSNLGLYFPEAIKIDEDNSLGIYEFYNVLWIEWEEGIAYRKNVGRVSKQAWHRQEIEEIDVILG